MGKSLKLLVAVLREIGENPLIDNNTADDTLPRNFRNTSSDVRAVLCYFSVSLFTVFFSCLSLFLCFNLDIIIVHEVQLQHQSFFDFFKFQEVFENFNVPNEFLSLQDVMRARDLEIPKLLNTDIPEFIYKDRLTIALLVYRDTINYLEYITQVFDKMNQTLTEQFNIYIYFLVVLTRVLRPLVKSHDFARRYRIGSSNDRVRCVNDLVLFLIYLF